MRADVAQAGPKNPLDRGLYNVAAILYSCQAAAHLSSHVFPMRPLYANLIGWGHYGPPNVVTNEDLTRLVDTTDEWIRKRSGIRERRFAGVGETTATLAAEAARRAMARAGIGPDDLDLIIVTTSSPDYMTPPVSSQVQHAIGATKAGAMTMMVGCTGFVYGLITASQFIQNRACRTVLVVGAEVISRNLDWTDHATCVLFGDGAGAVVLQATETPCGVRSFEMGSDGSDFDAIIIWSPGIAEPASQKVLDERRHYLRMNGRKVLRFAMNTVGASLGRVMDQAGVRPEDVDLFIPHQANARIIEYVVEQLGLPVEKVVVNVDRFGNTSAASIPIALAEALDAGRAKPGDTLALVGFGAGLTWAATVFDLGPMQAESPHGHERAGSVVTEAGLVEGLIA